MCTVGSGQCGRAGLSIGLADRSSHQPLARAIVRSHLVKGITSQEYKSVLLPQLWFHLRSGGGL